MSERPAKLTAVTWVLAAPMPPTILENRLCRNAPLDWFYPAKGSFPIGKEICGKCSVVDECLEFALVNEIRFGIWGGKNDLQRKQIMKARLLDERENE